MEDEVPILEKPPVCPECGKSYTLYRDSDKTLSCRRCGHRWKKPGTE